MHRIFTSRLRSTLSSPYILAELFHRFAVCAKLITRPRHLFLATCAILAPLLPVFPFAPPLFPLLAFRQFVARPVTRLVPVRSARAAYVPHAAHAAGHACVIRPATDLPGPA